MTAACPSADAYGPFFIGDDDVVTGDYANPLKNKSISIIFVIVTMAPLMGQLAHDEVEPLGRDSPLSRPRPGRGEGVLDRTPLSG
jgi:hypothetical protein